MNKVIIFTNDDGNCSICFPSGEISVEEVQAKDIPVGIQSYIVDKSSLPEEDYDFIDAWEQTEGIITINIAKAKEITKERLRVEREPLLVEQDILFQRALEEGSDTTAIIAEKKRLRDITTLVDAETTLTNLRLLKA